MKQGTQDQKKKLRGVECMIMAGFLFLIGAVTLFTGSMSQDQRQELEKQHLQKQKAVISRIDFNHRDVDFEFDQNGDNETEDAYDVYIYDRYVTYTYQGKTYTDIYLDQIKSRTEYGSEEDPDVIGQKIGILIHPDDPVNIMLDVNHGKPFEIVMKVIAVGFLAFGVHLAILGIQRSERSSGELQKNVRVLVLLPWIMVTVFMFCRDLIRSSPAALVIHLLVLIAILVIYLAVLDKRLGPENFQNGHTM